MIQLAIPLKNRRLFSVILLMGLLFIINSAYSQTQINTKSDFIDADLQGNIYIVNKTNLLKYNTNGQLLYKYSNNILGNISSIDVSNPLRILVFFKESNNIVYLNKQLSEINSPIQIEQITNVQAELVTSSISQGFWSYEKWSETLSLFTTQGNSKVSVNIVNYINDNSALFLSQHNGQIYLQTNNNLLIFDEFGNFIKLENITTSNKINITNKYYIYYKTPNLYFTDRTTLKTEHKELPPNVLNAIPYKDKLILQYTDFITIQ